MTATPQVAVQHSQLRKSDSTRIFPTPGGQQTQKRRAGQSASIPAKQQLLLIRTALERAQQFQKRARGEESGRAAQYVAHRSAQCLWVAVRQWAASNVCDLLDESRTISWNDLRVANQAFQVFRVFKLKANDTGLPRVSSQLHLLRSIGTETAALTGPLGSPLPGYFCREKTSFSTKITKTRAERSNSSALATSERSSQFRAADTAAAQQSINDPPPKPCLLSLKIEAPREKPTSPWTLVAPGVQRSELSVKEK